MTDPHLRTAHTRMVDRLIAAGSLRSRPWIDAFRAVPRHPFLPRFFRPTATGDWQAVDADDPDWADQVYEVTSVVTQLDNDDTAWQQARRTPRPGTPSSSSTDPGLMAVMLEALDVQDGHAVLEIGTGTGYNAALLAHRLGSDQVTSVEIDAGLADRARTTLRTLGYTPCVVAGDGATGDERHAPYDRVLATVAAPTVPTAWLRQTTPGGRILLNVYAELGGGALLLLTAHGGYAEGRFLPDYGSFMPTRDAQPGRDLQSRFRTALRGPHGERSTLDLPADALHASDFAVLAGLLVPDVGHLTFSPDGQADQLWLLGDDGCWAMLDTATGTAEQYGPRHIADELAATYHTWLRLGRPHRDRLGMTITRSGDRHLWLDQPHQTINQIM